MGIGHSIVIVAATLGLFIFFILAFALAVGSGIKDRILCVLFFILGFACAIIAFKDYLFGDLNKESFLYKLNLAAAALGMLFFFILVLVLGMDADGKWEKALTIIYAIMAALCAFVAFKDKIIDLLQSILIIICEYKKIIFAVGGGIIILIIGILIAKKKK